jgi:hypothetical protein
LSFLPALHKFHKLSTSDREEEASTAWKTTKTLRLSAQLLGQFADEPV